MKLNPYIFQSKFDCELAADVQLLSLSDSLWLRGMQHARLLSCTISWSLLKFTPIVLVMLSNHSSSSASLTFCLQSFPASGSSPKSCFFVSSGQSTGASASASFLLWILKSWFPSGLTGLIYLQSTGLSKVFSGMTIQSISSSVHSLFNGPTLTSLNDYWKKNYSFD